MQPIPRAHRPQTIKQAKKAYRKSGATKRLSESELAVIERRAELQERADRMKAREARRKANIKRKEERNEREREMRREMGLPEPVKEGFHVGPSQLSLGKFVVAGQKRKRDGSFCEDIKVDKEEAVDTKSEACQTSSLQRKPWRNPLKIISPNAKLPESLPVGASKNRPPRTTDLKKPQIPPPWPPPLTSNPKIVSPKKSTQQKQSAIRERPRTAIRNDIKEQKSQPVYMGPPPLRRPSHLQNTTTISNQKLCNDPPQDKPPDMVEDCWDDFFASSTQIARELSPPSTQTIPIAPPPPVPATHLQPPVPFSIPPKHDTTTLLNQISTQDLDFSDELTQPLPHILSPDTAGDQTHHLLAQISTQDLDFFSSGSDLTQMPPPAAPPEISSSDFDEDLTEEDLEDIVLEFERESTTKSESSKLTPKKEEEEEEEKVAVEKIKPESYIKKNNNNWKNSQQPKHTKPKDSKPGSPNNEDIPTSQEIYDNDNYDDDFNTAPNFPLHNDDDDFTSALDFDIYNDDVKEEKAEDDDDDDDNKNEFNFSTHDLCEEDWCDYSAL